MFRSEVLKCPLQVTPASIPSPRCTNAAQEKVKTVEDLSLGSSCSGAVVDRMDSIGGFVVG